MEPFQLPAHLRSRLVRLRLPENEYLFVNIARQRLSVVRAGVVTKEYPVSTSRWGVGSQEGSNKTPRGIHRIAYKIGAGAPRFRIFRSRQDTGIDWRPGIEEENLILTRILWLEGLEEGINRGAGVDTLSRYIYLHGTNQEAHIGEPISHGCVCMKNNDIIELFERVEEGTIVIIN